MNFISFNDVSSPIGTLVFLLLVTLLYYHKKKVSTIENYIYSTATILLAVAILLEIDCAIIPKVSLNEKLITFFYKLKYVFEIMWSFVLTLYIIVSSSSRNQGYIPYSENKEKKFFNKLVISCVISIIVFLVCVISLDLKYDSNGIEDILFANVIFKTAVILILCWAVSTIYYLIIRRRFEKGKSVIDNTNGTSIRRIVILILLDIIMALLTFLFVGVPENITFTVTGFPAYFRLTAVLIAIFICNVQVVSVAERVSPKKYIPIILLTPFFTVASICNLYLEGVFPEIAVFAAVTVYLYFSMENPDVKLIQELNLSRVEADSANLQKTRFLSVMSHEIRTPLNAIVGFGQSLKDADISDEAKEEVEDIIMASNNLLDIVNGILDISKIETDDLEIVEKDYDSKKMFKEIVALAKARLASKPIDFRINIDVSIPPVLHGDYLRVKQVIVNILTNSIKYTREGYIDFSVKSSTNGDRATLDVTVKDTGIGIKEEDLNKLFTKFQRLDLEKNSSTEGTGLGLAITKRLVELMNGSIDVSSVYGEGTTFEIKIEQGIIHKTVSDVNRTDDQKAMVQIDPNTKILVVDDNLMNIKVFARLLKDYGVVPDQATSGEEAINLVKSGHRYDLMFLDDMMPNLTGTKTLELLRGMSEFKTPVIAFTANAISGMREEYLAHGFNEYLPKPVKKEALNEILDIFLSNKKAFSGADVRVVPQLKVAAGYDVPIQVPKRDIEELSEDTDVKFVEKNLHNEYHTKAFLEEHGVDVNHGIGILGDMETYNMLIDDFNKGIDERVEKIKRLKELKDWANYAIETHDLKKDAKYLGFMRLADIAYKHELAGKEGNEEEINNLFKSLIDETTGVVEVVRKYCKE